MLSPQRIVVAVWAIALFSVCTNGRLNQQASQGGDANLNNKIGAFNVNFEDGNILNDQEVQAAQQNKQDASNGGRGSPGGVNQQASKGGNANLGNDMGAFNVNFGDGAIDNTQQAQMAQQNKQLSNNGGSGSPGGANQQATKGGNAGMNNGMGAFNVNFGDGEIDNRQKAQLAQQNKQGAFNG